MLEDLFQYVCLQKMQGLNNLMQCVPKSQVTAMNLYIQSSFDSHFQMVHLLISL